MLVVLSPPARGRWLPGVGSSALGGPGILCLKPPWLQMSDPLVTSGPPRSRWANRESSFLEPASLEPLTCGHCQRGWQGCGAKVSRSYSRRVTLILTWRLCTRWAVLLAMGEAGWPCGQSTPLGQEFLLAHGSFGKNWVCNIGISPNLLQSVCSYQRKAGDLVNPLPVELGGVVPFGLHL